jgi:hypothetical protein
VFSLPGFDTGAQFVGTALRIYATHSEAGKQSFDGDTKEQSKQHDDDDPDEH